MTAESMIEKLDRIYKINKPLFFLIISIKDDEE